MQSSCILAIALAVAGCGPVYVVQQPPPPATQNGPFGAIAYSASTGQSSASWGWATRELAEHNAVTTCGVRDCGAVAWVSSQCAAVAVDAARRTSWGTDVRRAGAELAAMTACSKRGRGCEVVRWVCSR